MNRQQKKEIRKNAMLIKHIGKKKHLSFNGSDAHSNMKGALIGGGVGVLIAVATKRNLIVGGILGLILGRFIFKID